MRAVLGLFCCWLLVGAPPFSNPIALDHGAVHDNDPNTLDHGVVLDKALAQQQTVASPKLSRQDSALLPNLILVNEHVYSGGQPEGDSAFAELRTLGIRTIISVDGAKPEVELAKRHGLRYVHLPHGYDGISKQHGKQLAKAMRSLEGPFYIHCHHGKHRSPAATAVACVNLGWLNSDAALKLLTIAGTDTRYQGLYRSVQNAQLLEKEDLATVPDDFPSVSKLPPMAESMVEIEQHFGHLKTLQQQNWNSADQKENSLQKALMLFEQFRELQRIDDPRIKNAEFVAMSLASEQAALTVERTLSSSSVDSFEAINKLNQAMKVIEANCKSCHQLVRD
jgi:protein tyrosine phosphatase (PTP) superfamily phosphohydrolase (DUF442 family)